MKVKKVATPTNRAMVSEAPTFLLTKKQRKKVEKKAEKDSQRIAKMEKKSIKATKKFVKAIKRASKQLDNTTTAEAIQAMRRRKKLPKNVPYIMDVLRQA